MADSLDDGGYSSRKFLMCGGAALLIAIIGIVAALWIPALVALYGELIGGVLGACGVYVTGNVANTMVVSRASASAASAPGAVVPGASVVPSRVVKSQPQVVMEPMG